MPILPYLKAFHKIWCPFDKDGNDGVTSNFVSMLRDDSHEVVATHIDCGGDFFSTQPPKGSEAVVSNPPFSLKNTVFERLYEIGLPFAMLMSINGIFDSKFRFDMFRKNGVEVLYLSKRIRYIDPVLGQLQGSPPFQSAYVCHGVLPSPICFANVDEGI